MSKDVAARLDALTQDYREGRLSLTAYRNLRAPILDVLMSQPAMDDSDQSTQRDRVTRVSATVSSLDEPPVRRGLAILMGLSAIAVVATAVMTYFQSSDGSTAVSPGTAAPQAQGLEESEDWNGARLHSMLADFDARAVCRKELAGSPAPFCRDLLVTADAGPELLVLAGNAGQPGHLFAISVHEISQGQFRSYCSHSARRCTPSRAADDSVVKVTWDEARQYLRWLSEMSGQTYRLPTEAEWQQVASDARKSGWPAKRMHVWTTQDRQSPDTSGPSNGKETRTLRAVREIS